MVDPMRTSQILAEAQRTARKVLADGILWLVYELPALPFDRRTTASLVFENENTVRRVRDYPADWRSLSDEQLFLLSAKT